MIPARRIAFDLQNEALILAHQGWTGGEIGEYAENPARSMAMAQLTNYTYDAHSGKVMARWAGISTAEADETKFARHLRLVAELQRDLKILQAEENKMDLARRVLRVASIAGNCSVLVTKAEYDQLDVEMLNAFAAPLQLKFARHTEAEKKSSDHSLAMETTKMALHFEPIIVPQ